jgi:hypothetical protein
MNETAEQFIARKQAYPGTMSHMESPGENTSWDLVIEASTYYAQSNSDSKVFVIQRLSGMPNNDREYRIGYYRRDGNGHWMWTQRSPMFPLHDLEMLMALARVEGTIL